MRFKNFSSTIVESEKLKKVSKFKNLFKKIYAEVQSISKRLSVMTAYAVI